MSFSEGKPQGTDPEPADSEGQLKMTSGFHKKAS